MKNKILTILVLIVLLFSIIPLSVNSQNPINKRIDLKTTTDLLKIDNLILKLMELSHQPSLSACIIKNDKLVWAKSYGLSDIENKTNATINTAYLIGSITKVFTATAVMKLFENGFINLSDDVNKYTDIDIINPYYPDDPITFEMLLCHKSSLDYPPKNFYEVYYDQDPPNLSSYMENYFCDDSEKIKEKWRNEKPGTKFHYSNLGYTVLGYLVEIVTRENFNIFCKKNIFQPLNMTNTSFYYSELQNNNISLAKPYLIIDDTPYDIHIPLPYYSVIFYPAGGLWTTIEDISHFLIAHMNNGLYKNTKLLNKSNIEYMHKNKLGWMKSKKLWITMQGHSGSMYGYASYMFIKTNDNTGVITFRNMRNNLDEKDNIYTKLINSLLFFKAKFI